MNCHKLLGVGFLKACLQAPWQAALQLMLEDSKPKFRTKIDLFPVHAATKAEQWPGSIIKAELSDFSGSTSFSLLNSVHDVVNAY